MERRTIDFLIAVAKGEVAGHSLVHKFGLNPTVTANAVITEAGGTTYPGFNATAAETLTVTGGLNDVGALIASGTIAVDPARDEATGNITISDFSADFVAAGVTLGDSFLDDTAQSHCNVISVTKHTVTLQGISDGVLFAKFNAYRIARSTGTGAGVCKLGLLLDVNRDEHSEYVILNGTTPVDTVGTYLRCARNRVINAGSALGNVGVITIRQKVTTANIFSAMLAGYNQSMIAAGTIPRNHKGYIIGGYLAIANRNAAAVSGRLRVRNFGETFQVKEEIALNSQGTTLGQRVFAAPEGPILAGSDWLVEGDASGAVAVSAKVNLLLVEDGF